MANCLVTGHKGYIGSHVFETLKEKGHTVFGLDTKVDQKISKTILNKLSKMNIEYVFHLAATPRVPYSVENPYETLRNNVGTTSLLLEWSKNNNIRRFIFSSSSSVHGNGDDVPQSPYALQKRMSELECRLYSDLYGVDTVSLRYFNVYSGDQPADGPYATVISAWVKALKEKKPLRVDGTGNQSRDFCHVSDVVSANLSCMTLGGTFAGEAFDIGNGNSISLNEIKEYVQTRYNNVKFENAPSREGDVFSTLADSRPFFEKTGWSPRITIEDGLRECFPGEINAKQS